MWAVAYGFFLMIETKSGTGVDEPPSTIAVSERRLVSFIATVPVTFAQRYPLIIGAAALIAVTTLSTLLQWSGPTFLQKIGLGGTGVEVVEIDEEGVLFSTDDVLVRVDAPFGEVNIDVLATTLASEVNETLVTVPWSPVHLEGAAGRDVRTYVVDDGDILGEIADRSGVSMLALAYSNNIVDPDSIQPGDKLRIPPVDGVLHVVKKGETLNGIAKKYGADTAQILSYNGLPADGSVLTIGDELVVPNGEPPTPPKRTYVYNYSGPTYTTNRVSLGYYIAPTTGHNFGRRHSNNGVDISNSCGTPIYAAAAGYVNRSAASGWNGGYGGVIEITHPNGTETLYAHNARHMVSVGEYVVQGQLIALMGTTGRSTGCHSHFEVHGAVNPLVR